MTSLSESIGRGIRNIAFRGWQTVMESKLINRFDPLGNLTSRIQDYFDLFSASPTVDESKVNYHLARALYKGTVIEDDKGDQYGSRYLLASPFAKPIVDATAAFMMSRMPTIDLVDDQFETIEELVNKWLDDNSTDIFNAVLSALSEGDSYLLVKQEYNAGLVRLRPEDVSKVVDPTDYTKIIGYNVNSVSYDSEQGAMVNKKRYKTLYRKYPPYVVTIEVTGTDTGRIVRVDGVETDLPYDGDSAMKSTLAMVEDYPELFNFDGAERPLPIIHFANDVDAQSIYGESEYRNLYYLFLRYHEVLDNAIKNNVFNSITMPYITGVTDLDAFTRKNGVYDEVKKEYKFMIDPSKTIIGGENFDIKMLQAYDSVAGADKILNILFWLIVQASETPEFVFGTAVRSSKASVSEQMPVMVRKAQRKQKTFTSSVKELVKTVSYYMSASGNTEVVPLVDNSFSVVWGEILSEDTEERMKLVELLDGLGLVTDKTKMAILGVDRYVTDLNKELDSAKEEGEETLQNKLDLGRLFPKSGVPEDEENQNEDVEDVEDNEQEEPEAEMIKRSRVERLDREIDQRVDKLKELEKVAKEKKKLAEQEVKKYRDKLIKESKQKARKEANQEKEKIVGELLKLKEKGERAVK